MMPRLMAIAVPLSVWTKDAPLAPSGRERRPSRRAWAA
jgi:hypothetical protein